MVTISPLSLRFVDTPVGFRKMFEPTTSISEILEKQYPPSLALAFSSESAADAMARTVSRFVGSAASAAPPVAEGVGVTTASLSVPAIIGGVGVLLGVGFILYLVYREGPKLPPPIRWRELPPEISPELFEEHAPLPEPSPKDVRTIQEWLEKTSDPVMHRQEDATASPLSTRLSSEKVGEALESVQHLLKCMRNLYPNEKEFLRALGKLEQAILRGDPMALILLERAMALAPPGFLRYCQTKGRPPLPPPPLPPETETGKAPRTEVTQAPQVPQRVPLNIRQLIEECIILIQSIGREIFSQPQRAIAALQNILRRLEAGETVSLVTLRGYIAHANTLGYYDLLDRLQALRELLQRLGH